jgi:hypothetical protein
MSVATSRPRRTRRRRRRSLGGGWLWAALAIVVVFCAGAVMVLALLFGIFASAVGRVAVGRIAARPRRVQT